MRSKDLVSIKVGSIQYILFSYSQVRYLDLRVDCKIFVLYILICAPNFLFLNEIVAFNVNSGLQLYNVIQWENFFNIFMELWFISCRIQTSVVWFLPYLCWHDMH